MGDVYIDDDLDVVQGTSRGHTADSIETYFCRQTQPTTCTEGECQRIGSVGLSFFFFKKKTQLFNRRGKVAACVEFVCMDVAALLRSCT